MTLGQQREAFGGDGWAGDIAGQQLQAAPVATAQGGENRLDDDVEDVADAEGIVGEAVSSRDSLSHLPLRLTRWSSDRAIATAVILPSPPSRPVCQ